MLIFSVISEAFTDADMLADSARKGVCIQMKEKICAAVGTAGGLIVSALGGWDAGLQVLLCFMAVDFCTGLLTAAVFHHSAKTRNGRLDSRRCFEGICRKCSMLLLVAAANAMDLLLESSILRSAVVIGFCTNEAISITENAGLMGIPLPAAWKNAVSVLSHGNSDNNKTETKTESGKDAD